MSFYSVFFRISPDKSLLKLHILGRQSCKKREKQKILETESVALRPKEYQRITYQKGIIVRILTNILVFSTILRNFSENIEGNQIYEWYFNTFLCLQKIINYVR